MLIHSASQLLTLAGPPQRGHNLGNLNMISDGAVLLQGDEILAVGNTKELLSAHPHEPKFDAAGRVVLPGFVDPHTHLLWVGDRAAEFEMRLQGKSYLEILKAGGGILSTVRATREASLETMIEQTKPHLQSMFRHGTTTAEAKTGYGLEIDTELRMLQALYILDQDGPLDLASTFLGAHAIPPEYTEDTNGYVDHLCQQMLPAVHSWWERCPTNDPKQPHPLPFVDVFCETGAFDLEQSSRILKSAQDLGFPLKIHADEFDNLGGTALAVELEAVSADHLVATSRSDIHALSESDTVAVALPCTPFGLSEQHYTPARDILSAGGLLAIATDLNPGTAWCESMQFAIALACRYMLLTPAQAISAATINAAAAIDRDETIGSIEPGKQADLLILDVPDYRHLGYRFGTNLVHTVVKKGELHPVKG
jgi:imidazolonepropionase